jgi:hypothetical protein
MNDLNTKLKNLNNQIEKKIQNSQPEYQDARNEMKQKLKMINKNKLELTKEQLEISQILKQEDIMKRTNDDLTLGLNANYSQYILLLIITISLVIAIFLCSK